MKFREYWADRCEKAWERRSIIWLSGVRRVGKTVLCRSLPDVEYFDCELPRVREALSDPEAFLRRLAGKRVVLDEIQRVRKPSEVLKIAADHYPDVRIVATGSSTLQASAKFRDTLTGRKVDVRLRPMVAQDLSDFGSTDVPGRMLRGGLPPLFLSDSPAPGEYEDWMDSFWAKDVQELFRLERRWSFVRLCESLLAQSGGILDASSLAAPCEIGRTTVSNYIEVLEATGVVVVVRPFSTHHPTEIVAAPKVYGFDTGFVAHYRGIVSLRAEDRGLLWEHLVLNEMLAHLRESAIGYWRDKHGHEVDFVIKRHGLPITAVECKWSSSQGVTTGLASFRKRYSEGENWLVAGDVDSCYERTLAGLPVTVMGLSHLAARLGANA
ncbi:MAG: ATP-binding protein [Armatimonadetes bacterium]|nr:ATP-binding protein [Armatimonadota bacterium]